MKKEYRNSLRSKKLIRQAFIELLREKKLEHITVVDIAGRADISRNTFYAHYQDVYAVLEEFQSEILDSLMLMLGDDSDGQKHDGLMPQFRQIAAHVDENKAAYRVLMESIPHSFISSDIRQLMLNRSSARLKSADIGDKTGFSVFSNIVISGFFNLMHLYLMEKIDLTSEEIVRETEKIYRRGIMEYK